MVQELFTKLGVSGVGLVFLVVGLYRIHAGRTERAQSARIADTETTRTGDVQPGTVEVKGTARLADDATLLESPIRKADALAVHVEVEEWDTHGQGSGGSWETVHETVNAAPLTVDDGTGAVRVERPPDGALNVEQTRTEVGSGDDPPEAVRRYVENEAGIDVPTRRDVGPLSVGERRRYSEGVIEPGEEVYVLGTAREAEAGWGDREYVIDAPTAAGDFVLSDKSEADLVAEGKRGGLVVLGFGVVLAVVGAVTMVLPWVGT